MDRQTDRQTIYCHTDSTVPVHMLGFYWRAKRASSLSCQLSSRYIIFVYLYIYIYTCVSTCHVDLRQNRKTNRQNDDAR